MSEAYLFAVSEAASPEGLIHACLSSAHVQPGWLNEVHWIGEAPALQGEAPALQGEAPSPLEGKTLFTWPESPLLAHFILQAALRELMSGAADLILLGQTSRAGTAALLLGSPVVVGRWNLPPLASLTPLACARPKVSQFLSAAAAGLPEGEAPAFLGLSGLSRADAQAAFPAARCLDGEAGDFYRVWQLLQALERSNSSRALLLSAGAAAGLATLVEKL
jgi:hypothetical protein